MRRLWMCLDKEGVGYLVGARTRADALGLTNDQDIVEVIPMGVANKTVPGGLLMYGTKLDTEAAATLRANGMQRQACDDLPVVTEAQMADAIEHPGPDIIFQRVGNA